MREIRCGVLTVKEETRAKKKHALPNNCPSLSRVEKAKLRNIVKVNVSNFYLLS